LATQHTTEVSKLFSFSTAMLVFDLWPRTAQPAAVHMWFQVI